MGNLINKKTIIDAETGEILREKNWIGFDGFNENGFQYRRKSVFIRYYWDTLPDNLSENAMLLLFTIAELMNEENMLVYRIKRKSKFSDVIYKPMEKEDIRQRTRFKFGENRFDKAWSELNKHCLKRIRYHEYLCWAVNPSVLCKCNYVPFWLYEEFKTYMNPHLTATTIKKLDNKINSQYE